TARSRWFRSARRTACTCASSTTGWGSPATAVPATAWAHRSCARSSPRTCAGRSTGAPPTAAARRWCWTCRCARPTEARAQRCGSRTRGGVVSAGAAGAGCAALERAALVLAHPAPDAGVLAGLEGPLQAGLDDLAAAADPLGLLDLEQGRTGVPDGEEQLRILVQTRSTMAPVHGFLSGGRRSDGAEPRQRATRRCRPIVCR